MLKSVNSKKWDDSGQSLVEFALVLLPFLTIVFFIIDFGWVTFQRTVFEYAYTHSSWSLSALSLGDNDAMEDTATVKYYTETTVPATSTQNIKNVLYSEFENSYKSIIKDNLSINNSAAKLYNEENDDYFLPDRNGQRFEAVSLTRYMELNAELTYVIYPITPIGKLFFKDKITITKDLEKTKIVKTRHISE